MIARNISHANLRCRWFTARVLRGAACRQSSTRPLSDERSDFLFGPSPETFRSLGLNQQICDTLERLGKGNATVIQAAAFAPIRNGKNVVMTAETGTGKTLAYLCPLFDKLFHEGRDVSDDAAVQCVYPAAIVLVPNKELGHQVMAMANEVLSSFNSEETLKPMIGMAWEKDSNKPYSTEAPAPTILICTPNSISRLVKNNIEEMDEAFFESIQHLVLDEADLLLDGDFLKQIERILTAFKRIQRRLAAEGGTQPVQKILAAATLPSSGKKSVASYVDHHFGRFVRVSNEHVHRHHPRISQEFVEVVGSELAALNPIEYVDVIVKAIYDQTASRPMLSRRTEPLGGGAQEDSPAPAVIPLTIVFVNTAKSALQLAGALATKGVPCGQFHKLMKAPERIDALEKFKAGKVPVLVATDHAARGLDIPDVHHIIQSEFAENVVQHLHRIGRSSRGGAAGHATNFYSGKNQRDLVEVILENVEEVGDVENSFSRRRGLRRRIKRFEDLKLSQPDAPRVTASRLTLQPDDRGLGKKKRSSFEKHKT